MSPIGTILQPLTHDLDLPSFDEARVVDAMRMGVVSVPPDATVDDIAGVMAAYRIHAVLVRQEGGEPLEPSSIVSDVDLARAAAGDRGRTAAEIGGRAPVTVAADESLERAARLMGEEDVSHLLVVQPSSGHAVGVLSSLDLADVLAWGSID